jgi:hypothetical protein
MSAEDPADLLRRTLASGRVHGAYLLAGPGPAPRDAAVAFVRGLVCRGAEPRPCEACAECRRSGRREAIALDGSGRTGPLLRHVGDHPDLLWVERGADDTRVRIGQIRALQHALRLRGEGAGRRAAVVADADWLNVEAQNALLRVLEEPPPRTSLVLVARGTAGLLATVRSRCQRVVFRSDGEDALAAALQGTLAERLEGLARAPLASVLDWAEEFRGDRGAAAAALRGLLDTAGAWLRVRTRRAVAKADGDPGPELAAWSVLSSCRKSLDQRNANPQMVAERALFALREAGAR